jgi:hypothetical protein
MNYNIFMKLMRLIFLLTIGIILVPDIVFAWGPITHIYLGSKILSLAPLLPAGIYSLIERFREDFLYGNIMADIILAKKYLPVSKNSHSWDMAFELMDSANTPEQKAFVYGYMSHLAADTVVHERNFSGNLRNHAFLELKSDSMIGRRYWLMAITIDKNVQKRNDLFLESNLTSPFISVRTSKKIFKGMILLAGLTPRKMTLLTDRRPILQGLAYSESIKELHRSSIERIVDLLNRGECSRVIGISPSS